MRTFHGKMSGLVVNELVVGFRRTSFQPPQNKDARKDISKLLRSQMRRFFKIINRQNNLNYVQIKFNGESLSELCIFCEEEDEAQ